MTLDDQPATLGPTLDFMRLVWALDHALQKRSKQMARRHGVTGPQRLALRLIGRTPGVSAGDLAEALKIHPSTLTGVLQRLEDRRLVVRKADQGDRRRARLALTPRGRAVTAASHGTIEDVVSRVLREAPRKQVASVGALLQALVIALDPAAASTRERDEG